MSSVFGTSSNRHARAAQAILPLVLAIIVALGAVLPDAITRDPAFGDTSTSRSLRINLFQRRTGTPPWDSSSGNGFDSSPSNTIVRTNDTIEYSVEVSVVGGDPKTGEQNTTFALELPKGLVVGALPAYCQKGQRADGAAMSSLSSVPFLSPPFDVNSWKALPQQRLVCDVGFRSSNSTVKYPVLAKVRGEVPNRTVYGSAAAPIVAAAYSDSLSTPVRSTQAVRATVSAGAKADISINSISPSENGGYLWSTHTPCSDGTGLICRAVYYPILISIPRGGKGSTPLKNSIRFDVDLSAANVFPNAVDLPTSPSSAWRKEYGAVFLGCEAQPLWTSPGSSLTEYQRAVYYNDEGVLPKNTVRESGRWTCSQPGGPGTALEVRIDGADTSASTAPSEALAPKGNPLPADRAYIISGYTAVEVPIEVIRDYGVGAPNNKDLIFDPRIVDFSPEGIDGSPNSSGANESFNDHRAFSIEYRSRGGFWMLFTGYPGAVGNKPAGIWSPGWPAFDGPPGSTAPNSGDGTALDGQPLMSTLYFRQSSIGPQLAQSAVGCDTFDPKKLRLYRARHPISTVPSGYTQSGPLTDEPVYVALRSGPMPTGLIVEYGTGAVTSRESATCSDEDSPTGWTTDPNAAVHGNDQDVLATDGTYTKIAKVRFRLVLPPASDDTYTFVNIAKKAVGVDPTSGLPYPDRTILASFVAAKYSFEHSPAELLSSDIPWQRSAYDPSIPSGYYGDRILLGRAITRIRKEVQDPDDGAWVSGQTPQVNAGDTVRYKLSATVTAAVSTATMVPVRVEDCVGIGQAYDPLSASVQPSMIEVGQVPGDAVLRCSPGETYVRWDLGSRQINVLIPDITYSTTISTIVESGSIVKNVASISTKGDGSYGLESRSSQAQVQVVTPSGVVVEHLPLTPLTQVSYGTTRTPKRWLFTVANLGLDDIANVDVIDLLPRKGIGGTNYRGSYEFVSISSQEPAQTQRFLYTSTPSANLNGDPFHESNDAVSGTTVWCNAPSGGAVVMGAGNAAQCPSSPAQVTAVRVLRAGGFEPDERLSYTIEILPNDDAGGDVYVNRVTGRFSGLASEVGPVDSPQLVVDSAIGNVAWFDKNANGRQDQNEPGIAGVRVRLFEADGSTEIPIGPDGELRTADDTTGGVLTTSSGEYRFKGLRSGDYRVSFETPNGYLLTAPNRGLDESVDSDVLATEGNTASVVLPQGVRLDSIDVGYFKLTSLSGRVYLDPNGDLSSGSGIGDKPLEGVAIRLTGTDGAGRIVNRSATTNGDGSFAFPSLIPSGPAGYTLSEEQPFLFGDAIDRAGSGASRVGDVSNDEISGIGLLSGDNATDYEFTEKLAKASIAGRVRVAGTGKSIPGVSIELSGVDQWGTPVLAKTVTNANGEYKFEDVEGSNQDGYALTETQPTNYLDSADYAGTAGGLVGNDIVSKINLRPGKTESGYDFTETEPMASLSGKVTLRSGEPVSDVTITLVGKDIFGDNIRLVTQTELDGTYKFPEVPQSSSSGYVVVETQPFGYEDGESYAGNLGGQPTVNAILGILLTADAVAVEYNFDELRRWPVSITTTTLPGSEKDHETPDKTTTTTTVVTVPGAPTTTTTTTKKPEYS